MLNSGDLKMKIQFSFRDSDGIKVSEIKSVIEIDIYCEDTEKGNIKINGWKI